MTLFSQVQSMKTILKLTILLLLLSCSSRKVAQHKKVDYCREQTLTSFEWKFDFDMDTLKICDFVLEEGIIHKLSLENAKGCESPDLDDFIIDYIEPDGQILPHLNCDVLLIFQSKRQQSREEKTKLLKELQEEYEGYKGTPNDYRCPSCKMVIINGESDFPARTREKLHNLKVKDIVSIKVYDKPMNPLIYGEWGNENGIIEIETK